LFEIYKLIIFFQRPTATKPSGLASILDKISKKPKINTLVRYLLRLKTVPLEIDIDQLNVIGKISSRLDGIQTS
jgi:hypothetical protein